MQPNGKRPPSPAKPLTRSTATEYLNECVPPETAPDVDLRKHRVRPPNHRPPSTDFLRRSREELDKELEEMQQPSSETRASLLVEIELAGKPSAIAPKKERSAVPAWLAELKMRKTKNSEEVGEEKTEAPPRSKRHNKKEARPTIAELRRGAERIGRALAELQRDVRHLSEQIERMGGEED